MKTEHSVLSSESLANPRLSPAQKEFRQPVKVQASPLKISSVAAETSRTGAAIGTKGL